MINPRVIPVLLLDGDALVKTVAFDDARYVGDPVNVLSIFSSFEVDEIVLLDIRATLESRGPRLALLERYANECMIPLAYGGGITSAVEIEKVLEIGYEKVVVNTSLWSHPEALAEAARTFGSQAIVASVDVRRVDDGFAVVVSGGTRQVDQDPASWARRAEDLGAGEILVTSVDRDGAMDGYDQELIELVASSVSVPVIACGGAGKRAQLVDPIKVGAAASAAGSLFVFQGRGRGVVINYPSRTQLRSILG